MSTPKEILDNLVFSACEYEAGKDVDLDADTNKAMLAIHTYYTNLFLEMINDTEHRTGKCERLRILEDKIREMK